MYDPPLKLTKADVSRLQAFIKKGTRKAREIARAQILLSIREGEDAIVIAKRVRVSRRTVTRVWRRFEKGGLDRALYDAPRSGQPLKTSVIDDAHLVALACTDAPEGSAHWTLDLLTEQFVKERKKKLGRTAIWLRLKTRAIKPWREKNVVHPEGHAGVR